MNLSRVLGLIVMATTVMVVGCDSPSSRGTPSRFNIFEFEGYDPWGTRGSIETRKCVHVEERHADAKTNARRYIRMHRCAVSKQGRDGYVFFIDDPRAGPLNGAIAKIEIHLPSREASSAPSDADKLRGFLDGLSRKYGKLHYAKDGDFFFAIISICKREGGGCSKGTVSVEKSYFFGLNLVLLNFGLLDSLSEKIGAAEYEQGRRSAR